MEEHIMKDYEQSGHTSEQASRAKKLFASVVLAALDDAIADNRKYGKVEGNKSIARWARSRDGQKVLTCAGIDPSERTIKGMMEFVQADVPTAKALSQAGKGTNTRRT